MIDQNPAGLKQGKGRKAVEIATRREICCWEKEQQVYKQHSPPEESTTRLALVTVGVGLYRALKI